MSKKKERVTSIERVLIALHELAGSDTRYALKAQGLLGWYSDHGELTVKQRIFAMNMVGQYRKVGVKANLKPYYLYAIDDGSFVKLGYSHDPQVRRRTMQTGQANALNLVWKLKVGMNKAIAIKAEKQLHRFCRKYKKRGEWFYRECMVVVQQFELKAKMKERSEEEEVELAIVSAANERV